MNIPNSTYRLQFNKSFNFKDALSVSDYLLNLGISHIYASPVFKARAESMHGYDIVDPCQINPELEQELSFKELSRSIHQKGLGWIQDIVPNHMAIDTENKILMDILEHGKRSKFYDYYDIEWNHAYDKLKNRVLLPVLGNFYSSALDKQEIQLRCDHDGFCIKYYSLRLPVRIETYINIIEKVILSNKNNPEIKDLSGISYILKNAVSEKNDNDYYIQFKHAKEMLCKIYKEKENIKIFIDTIIEKYNGIPDNFESFDLLDELLSKQYYRLSFWKVAREEINYRRFFTINELISLKVENEEVFKNTHDLIISLVRDGLIDGLRVDHIDGLYDPADYLKKLNKKIENKYIITEKILETEEEFPASLEVSGTTGYDFLNFANGVLCCKSNKRKIRKIYSDFTGIDISYADITADKKRLIIGKHMAGNIDNLAQYLKKISASDRRGHDITLYSLRRALVELLVYFPVYRTYISRDYVEKNDIMFLQTALDLAREKHPGFAYELDFIERFLLLKYDEKCSRAERESYLHFVMSFQQQTGGLMAKGVEDTVFYVYNRLTSLNEVGADPSLFGFKKEEFHDFNINKIHHLPFSLNATSTHDTKRGEDTRMRINVLSEIPDEWNEKIKKWNKYNKALKHKNKKTVVPDKNDEYFLYQTLLGTYPFKYEPDYTDRIKEYIIKAVREAKVHTAWIKHDETYENNYLNFIDNILNSSQENIFLNDFIIFQKKIAFYGIFNSLSQTLLKMTCPGIPDFYQGTELWDFSLVDPDNRRQVEFDLRIKSLNYIKDKVKQTMYDLINELIQTKEDGRIKLFLIHRVLTERNNNIEIFNKGEYIPLNVKGTYNKNIIAFMRKFDDKAYITIVPRFLTQVVNEDKLPTGEEVWKDTEIILPVENNVRWIDTISSHEISENNSLNVGKIFKYLPAALLKK